MSVARNVGLAAATGEIIAYTDSDCVAEPDWLNYMVAKFLSSDLKNDTKLIAATSASGEA